MPPEVWVQIALNVPVLVLALVGVKVFGDRFDRLEVATRETTARVLDLLGGALERSDPGRHVAEREDEDTHDGNTEPGTALYPAPPKRRRK